MIKKKELLKQIESLSAEVKRLTEIVVTEELKTLREKEKRLEEQTELLESVRFKVKSAKPVDDGNGSAHVVVMYQLPTISIYLNENGEPIERIPFFYSVNALGLVGIEDYQLIEKALMDAKKLIDDNTNKK